MSKPVILTESNLGEIIEGNIINNIINLTSSTPTNLTILSSNLPNSIMINKLNDTSYNIIGDVGFYNNNTKLEFTVRITNDIGFTDKYFFIDVVNIEPEWNQDILPNGSSYEYYEFQFTVFNPGGLTSFQLIEGELPPTLKLRNDGLVYGICDSVDEITEYNFKIRAITDTNNIEKSFSININPIPDSKAPVWLTPEGVIGSVENNQNVNIQLIAYDVNADQLTYVLLSGNLPTGLTLNSSGIISGIVNTEIQGAWPIIVRVSDGTFNVDRSFNIETNMNREYSINWITNSGNIGILKTGQYSQLNFQAESILPIKYKIISGNLPEGLFLQNNQIVGHVNNQVSGNYIFTVEASNSYVNINRTFSITVNQGTITGSVDFYLSYNNKSYNEWWNDLWLNIDTTKLYRSSDIFNNFNLFPKTYLAYNINEIEAQTVEPLIKCDVPFKVISKGLKLVKSDLYDVIVKVVEPIVDRNITTLNNKKRFTFRGMRIILHNNVGIDGGISFLPEWMNNVYYPCIEVCRVKKEFSDIIFEQLKLIDSKYKLPIVEQSIIMLQERANPMKSAPCVFYDQYSDVKGL